MLKKRVIAVLILRYGEVVQSVQFKHTNVIHTEPRYAVECFSKWDADEIVMLDVSRDTEQREKFLLAVERISRTCFVPLTVGGWLKDNDDIKQVLSIGADKVLINTEAYNRPEFIQEASARYGSQCIVVGIDCLRNDNNEPIVHVNRGRDSTGLTAVEWAKTVEKHGAGEILLTSIDNDGMRGGFDLDLMQSVSAAVSIPVIAFGGALTANHLAQGLENTGVDAVSAANMFHYSENSMRKMKRALKQKGLNIRF